MSNVKKAFQPIINLLQANLDEKVSDVIEQVIELTAAKSRAGGAQTFHRDEDGNVVAIFDYYFKKWMPLSHIEFGKKANSASGYNTMCKEGVSNWTKQQREFKSGQTQLLEELMESAITQEEAQERNAALEEAKNRIVPHSTGIGFETLEECLEADTDELDEMVQAALDAEAEQEESETAEE